MKYLLGPRHFHAVTNWGKWSPSASSMTPGLGDVGQCPIAQPSLPKTPGSRRIVSRNVLPATHWLHSERGQTGSVLRCAFTPWCISGERKDCTRRRAVETRILAHLEEIDYDVTFYSFLESPFSFLHIEKRRTNKHKALHSISTFPSTVTNFFALNILHSRCHARFRFHCAQCVLTLRLAVAVLVQRLLLYMFRGSLGLLRKQVFKNMHCSTTCTGAFTSTSSDSLLHSTRARFIFNWSGDTLQVRLSFFGWGFAWSPLLPSVDSTRRPLFRPHRIGAEPHSTYHPFRIPSESAYLLPPRGSHIYGA